MARADLHNAMAIDAEIWEAAQVDASLLDPVLLVEGALPGVARPFVVARWYQGPQGLYTEHFRLADAKGNVVHESAPRRITLTGEMFEDRVLTTLRDVRFNDGREHQLTFFVDDTDIGTIPVFIEAGLGGDPRTAAEETFKKAVTKGTILWVGVPQPDGREHTQPVWFVHRDDKVYLLTGPGEQEIPNLAEAGEVALIARGKDTRSQVTRVPCAVEVVPADDERYEAFARTGVTKRLNLPDDSLDAALERWKATCTLVELTPLFRDGEEPEAAVPAAAAAVAQETAGAPGAEAAPADAVGGGEETDEIEVEAQVDQEVFDQLIAEGKPERVARAKAKAAYVRKEKARIRAEREKTNA